MNNEIIYKIKKITIDELLKYHNPNVVYNYCKQCPDYNKFWSCPVFNFSEKEYIKKYTYAYIISAKLYTKEAHSNNDESQNDINLYYNSLRKIFDKKLLELEKNYENTVSLFAGRCYICEKCSKILNKPCIHPEYMRYSLESLGIEVTKIVEDILNDKILWSQYSKQEYILLVGALLSKHNIALNHTNIFK
ncbi:hypothetical protein CLTEP_13490 [Clostridium tepidiprofundi DSM 19306]|uniref:Metal-binding protein n=1 Tax=Clostridium tepidiprofundi DSM 19306 TaxID=1121338 RepID=A0A151B4N1_9CLOT|nr:DUF2284 domain-containing protein [Clostridium tepidiprofundi]KYH34750.1 hypothetical protein CLTEP_13490 [Clostridium tepidiprofundi DSM 19306]